MIISLKKLEELLRKAYDQGFDAGRADGLYDGYGRGFDVCRDVVVEIRKELSENGQGQSEV